LGEENEERVRGEVRTGCLASYSAFFGVGVFGFLELPEPWDLRMVPEPPECDLLGDWSSDGEFRWVLKGHVKAFMLNEGQKRAYLLRVEAKDFVDATKAEEHVERKLGKLKKAKNSEVIEEGVVDVSGHRARYVVLAVRKRKLIGRPKTIYKLVLPFYCDKTSRLLWVEVLGGPYLPSEVGTLLSIISSFSCHEGPPRRERGP